MSSSFIRYWHQFLAFLLKRIVLILVLLFCAGGGVALSNMAHLSATLIEFQARQNAASYVQTFNQAINLYSNAAVDRAKVINGITVTHTYLAQKGAIPVPSTFGIELGDLISERNDAMSFRMFSGFPFPPRNVTGGAKDQFEQDAIAFLKQNPKQPFTRLERKNGHLTLRYAEANLMKATCVACHNTHPKSPKKDWEVGDLGGVWEINQSLDNFVQKTNSNLQQTFVMLGSLSVLGVSGLTLVVGKLRQTARHLERRVRDRTSDLAQANVDLGKRNDFIRQVFGRYLSDNVVTNLLESPEGLKLGGERRRITILTSDLRGFTALSERILPEEVIQILNLYLEYMADVISRYQGTIDEFMGDGILVLFGAPITQEDAAARSIACACAMQLAMGAVNERMKASGLPRLEMGIGIHTGEVVVGNIGSEKRAKYGIVGSPVNLTYRIESYTTGGQILISEQTLREAGSIVRVSGQRQVQPKGVSQPMLVFEVYGIGGFYNLYLPREDELFFTVPTPIALQYTSIQGKQVNLNRAIGHLVKLSAKGAEIRPETAENLPDALTPLKLNLRINSTLSEDIYAKLLKLSTTTDHFYIQFTSVPPQIQVWLTDLYDAIVPKT